MNITVFCSARDISPAYVHAAQEVVEAFARAGHHLVWGGSNTGLMRTIADTAQAQGVKTIGVSVEFLKSVARKGATSMTIAADLSERKARMMELGDAFLVLPGGTGTLDEALSVLEYKKHDRNRKPVVFLNTNGFYDDLRDQLMKMQAEGFLSRPLAELAQFSTSPEDTLRALGVG